MGSLNITADQLRELLSYDLDRGEFRWRIGKRGRRVGRVIGHGGVYRYIRVGIGGARYYGHRLAWLYVYGQWPDQDIDHINGNGRDNRIANLRQASASQNLANRGPQRDNCSGLKGVHRHPNGQWRAQIGVRKRRIHLGLFKTQQEAAEAYAIAARKHFGEFARTSSAGGV